PFSAAGETAGTAYLEYSCQPVLVVTAVPARCLLPSATPTAHVPTSPARALLPQQRQPLARDAWAGRPLAERAQEQHVRRQFVDQQGPQAHDARDQAFAPPPPPADDLLCWLPVTQTWMQPLTLGLGLIGHRSVRGGTELRADLFDEALSVGAVHHIPT